MSYTPTTWTTGDTITASALNKIENGIASAGSALVVGVDHSYDAEPIGTLDKTFSEIYDALNDGIPVYIKTGKETSGPSTDYSCGAGLLPVLCAFKYNDTYRVYAVSKVFGKINVDYYIGCTALVTFNATSPSAYPTSTNCVVPSSAIDHWD